MPDVISGARAGTRTPPVQRPVDPSADPRGAPRKRETRRVPWTTLTAITTGGVLGALARYGLDAAYPYPPGDFSWTVFAINVSGCLLLGALMSATETWRVPAMVHPFAGVGLLGGFTTFSTHIVGTQQALARGAPGIALAYLAITAVSALAAVWAGVRLPRLVGRWRRHAAMSRLGRRPGRGSGRSR